MFASTILRKMIFPGCLFAKLPCTQRTSYRCGTILRNGSVLDVGSFGRRHPLVAFVCLLVAGRPRHHSPSDAFTAFKKLQEPTWLEFVISHSRTCLEELDVLLYFRFMCPCKDIQVFSMDNKMKGNENADYRAYTSHLSERTP